MFPLTIIQILALYKPTDELVKIKRNAVKRLGENQIKKKENR